MASKRGEVLADSETARIDEKRPTIVGLPALNSLGRCH